MKAIVRILLLGAALLVALVALGIGSFYLYRVITLPSLAKSGGTLLVYEVDVDSCPDGKLPVNYTAEDLVEAVKRRIDPRAWEGIAVTPVGETRVEVSLPRAGNHDQRIQQIKELLAQTGIMEFRILANELDDKDGIAAARAYIEAGSTGNMDAEKRDARRKGLDALAERGRPPPPPTAPDGRLVFEWARGKSSYSWVELGRQERVQLGLNNDAGKNPAPDSPWLKAKQARDKGEVFTYTDSLGDWQLAIFSRPCVNQRLFADERGRKQYDYFVLSRDPEPGKAITGQYLTSATEGPDKGGVGLAVHFRFNNQGGALFYEMTSNNRPSGSKATQFFRHLAIILDDQILSAPRLHEAIYSEGTISGNFTQQEVERLVSILRAGALPAPLKPLPVSETNVETAK